MRKIKILLYLILVILFFSKTGVADASEKKAFITIVNPVRIAPYTVNSKESLDSQYSEIRKRNLPATWLLTFDVINNKEASDFIKDEFDSNQELGIFMEVSSDSAKASGVNYNFTDSWHRSNSIFLSGYSQSDRIKLIDKVFESFKKEFGYYPVSVGAWWIDSFSLDYMSKKYNVIANLSVSDQLETDGYSIWGTPWSTPYIPSKFHAGIPASRLEDKLNVVTIQWAPRDPLNGYISPDKANRPSLYSSQDHFTIGLNENYFEKLIRLYTENDFDQVTIGLEGDFPKEFYQDKFSTQLSLAQKLSGERNISFATMKEFSKEYSKKYSDLSPSKIIEADDLLGSQKRVIWFQNPKYRIGIKYDNQLKQTEIFDLRSYYKNFTEPFYLSPNKQYNLFSILPSIIDSRMDGKSSLKLNTGVFVNSEKNGEEYILEFEKGKIILKNNLVEISGISFTIDPYLQDLGLVKVNGNRVVLPDEYVVPAQGIVFREFYPKIPFALKYRIPSQIIYLAVALVVLMAFIFFIFLLRKSNRKYVLTFVSVLVLSIFLYLLFRINRPLYISQSEIDALILLSNLKDGTVLVYDKDCLKCNWKSENKPAAMENRKDYVGKISKKPIIYSLDFVLAENPEEAKKILIKENPRYIYLSKYEDYVEVLSFNPEDLSVKKIYENANAVIYEVL
ncbi:MAG: hypothetical protein HYT09_03500 [Candidatus Levybacteria bacterium]|nr:hypothetical protein [Candidatus Levybacteria bacterium]